ncbi:uncharacterized protein MELLADRAFT_123806 [Melampsora larici-populina 98AG31]|uniref:Secreted protein n=1 Tax=Melampsora larici-populina (strain 98AG31 / pathotype 3-4-7) TaxID=747676 RepID=F4RG98_MELLP|nr:uncharacterized protein MELLADRAFT_123806 [Melampsora larici-populina 98AG31]EGG08704.1 secreted protein [Melampsora larici-populina 98AG31]
MLKKFLHIAFLVFASWLNVSKVMAAKHVKLYDTSCDVVYLFEYGVAKCGSAYDGHSYDCSPKNCRDGNKNYSVLVDCTHNGSTDQTTSQQDCAQYTYTNDDKNPTLNCINTKGYHYTCPYNKNKGKKIECKGCFMVP